jgi:hypothetical protein
LQAFVTRPKFAVTALLALAIALPTTARAQTPLAPGPGLQQQQQLQQPANQTPQPNTDEVGNVASFEGSATVTRNGASQPLKLQDPIFKGDLLRTGANSTLGVIFDDETTFNLSANSSIEVNEFVYESSGKSNAAIFNIARGTVAFAANQVAKTGDMKIDTPSTTLGIRGTSGVVEVPEGATPGTTGEVAVKLYQDEDGRVGRIELFGAGGGPRLGLLTRAATGFSLRAGGGGRFAAVPLTITPQQIARDRGFVQRTFAARSTGRQMIFQRQNLRTPGLQRQPNLRQPNLRQQNFQRNLQQRNLQQRNLQQQNPRQQNLRQQGGQQRGGPLTPGRGRTLNTPGGGQQGTPNLQRQNLQRQNLQRQNLQRPQLTPRQRQQGQKQSPIR